MRSVILFDIDGTLVRGGPAKTAFVDAMSETYGTSGPLKEVSFAGKTDPQIARELLLAAGLDHQEIDRGFERLWTRYLANLEALLPDDPVDVLPGVVELLDALAGEDDVAVGLLTGNIQGGARLKLSSGGLWEHFGFGSYGSDHEERDELPAIAVGRAREIYGEVISAELAVVVGDTPRDVACGKAGGTRTIAVATGTYTADALAASEPDHLLDDLSATSEVLDLLVR